MTSNQIAYAQAKETERANREREKETTRSNKAKEKEASAKRKQDLALGIANIATSFIPKPGNISLGGRNNSMKARDKVAKSFGFEANDPRWYNLDPQLVKDVANLSFEAPLGYVDDSDLDKQVYSNRVNRFRNILSSQRLAGVMTINVVPTIGSTDLINTAGLNIYSYVRHANSGSRNYEYQDMMKYLMAIDSVYIGIAELKRLYALYNTYKGDNKYYAQGYLRSLGLSTLELSFRDLSQLRYKINQMIARVNAFYVPRIMTMYTRHAWMAEGIFKDHPTRRSSNYMFHFKYLYKYDEVDGSASFGQLKPIEFFADKAIPTIVEEIEGLLTALELSEDIGLMSGDILKAYGESNLYYVDGIAEDYHIQEGFSQEVLSQINNTVTLGEIEPASLYIFEDSDRKLKQGYKSTFSITPKAVPVNWNTGEEETSSEYPWAYVQIQTASYVADFVPGTYDAAGNSFTLCSPVYRQLNMYKDDVTPDDVMVATRLTTHAQGRIYKGKSDNNAYTVNIAYAYGSEIATTVNIVYFTTNNELKLETVHDGFCLNDDAGNLTTGLFQGLIKNFDWAPRLRINYLKSTAEDGDSSVVTYHNRDLCNTAILTDDMLRNMHRVAITSELGIPLLGIKVRTR